MISTLSPAANPAAELTVTLFALRAVTLVYVFTTPESVAVWLTALLWKRSTKESAPVVQISRRRAERVVKNVFTVILGRKCEPEIGVTYNKSFYNSKVRHSAPLKRRDTKKWGMFHVCGYNKHKLFLKVYYSKKGEQWILTHSYYSRATAPKR